MKIKIWVLIVLSSILILGAKGCETNTKADVIEALGSNEIGTKDDIIKFIPELKEYSRKFELKNNDTTNFTKNWA